MDIVKAFVENNSEYKITIKGTPEDPLFRASDIAEILDIKNIRQVLPSLDDDDHVLVSINTPGGIQNVTFLTEKGLYHVLFTSRKQLAKQFRNWVCDVIKEIRLTGNYQLRKEIDDLKDKLSQKDTEIANKDYHQLIQIQRRLLREFRGKRGLYVILCPDGKLKFGVSKDVYERFLTHQREISKDIILLYVIATVYNDVIESKIKELCNDPSDILYGKRTSQDYNEKTQTELIVIDENFTKEDFWNRVLAIEKSLKPDEIFLELEREIETLKQTIENKDRDLNNKKIKEKEIKDKEAKSTKLSSQREIISSEDKKENGRVLGLTYILNFLQEFSTGRTEIDFFISCKDLYNKYTEYCTNNNILPIYILGTPNFGVEINQCPHIVDYRRRINNNRERGKRINFPMLPQWIAANRTMIETLVNENNVNH
jgi:prophage antirepressor-like protein